MERPELITKLSAQEPSQRRPILTLTNGDNSWIISIPRTERIEGTGGKAYYHILQDPWLSGVGIHVSSWLLGFQHKQKEAIDSADAVEAWIEEVETAAGGTKGDDAQWLDAIFITHTAEDHLHPATLKAFPRTTKIFAVADAAAQLTGMKLFDHVGVIPDFVRDKPWPVSPDLPAWLRVFRLPDEFSAVPVFYATFISFPGADGKDEMILYSPHGVLTQLVEDAKKIEPDVSVLAMIYATNMGSLTNKELGILNGLKLERRHRPKYWVDTHYEATNFWGLISWFISYDKKTMDIGLEEEAKEMGEGYEQRRPNLVQVGNGGSCILA